jgi:uncharacterized membrane protein YqiK
MPPVLTLLVGLALLGGLIAVGFQTLRYDVSDDETVLVVSGRHYRNEHGKPLPFDIIRDGTYIRYPVIETARTFSLTPIEFEWNSVGSPSELDQTLHLRGTAVVAPARDDDALREAIERFAGLEESNIPRIAANAIETTFQRHLQSIPGEIAGDPDGDWVDDIARHAADDLATYGLLLEDLSVDSVSDADQ